MKKLGSWVWNKGIYYTGIIVALALVFAIVFWVYSVANDTGQQNVMDTEVLANATEGNGSVDETIPLDTLVTDANIQSTLNKMAHQKVEADDKWGAIEITEQRLATLITQVNENAEALEHDDLYLDILNKWAEGDFDSADYDHNRILHVQGGTIGEATGLLSVEEEADFINSNFR